MVARYLSPIPSVVSEKNTLTDNGRTMTTDDVRLTIVALLCSSTKQS